MIEVLFGAYLVASAVVYAYMTRYLGIAPRAAARKAIGAMAGVGVGVGLVWLHPFGRTPAGIPPPGSARAEDLFLTLIGIALLIVTAALTARRLGARRWVGPTVVVCRRQPVQYLMVVLALVLGGNVVAAPPSWSTVVCAAGVSAYVLMLGLCRPVLAENGVVRLTGGVPWRKVKSHVWQGRRSEVLALGFRGGLDWPILTHFLIPPDRKTDVERLLRDTVHRRR